MISEMTRAEMEATILADRSLYAQYNEARLLNEEYTLDELKAVAQAWVEAGDECAASA